MDQLFAYLCPPDDESAEDLSRQLGAYCKAHQLGEPAEIFMDYPDAYGQRLSKRPDGYRLLLRASRVGTVVVAGLDQFGKNAKQRIRQLEMFGDLGIALHLVFRPRGSNRGGAGVQWWGFCQ